ncbi:hypothetical protein K2173_002444 [Erythroxylum novogranatense]|uniref:Adenylyl-sulfate kinase n=1 Tax=Erythroxylum novogranatense TaxID=1862640 RepID=A0AAV8TB50_9ROSI|nr:hypothetical protein K2173_002444 [Erythroxylum novogranatense]
MNAIGLKPVPGIRMQRVGLGSYSDGDHIICVMKKGFLRIKAMEGSHLRVNVNGKGETVGPNGSCLDLKLANEVQGKNGNPSSLSTVGNSTNVKWHECSVGKSERQSLINQKGCVVWITGLSGSGKSTVACALSQILCQRGKLSYILDGDNVRHGLNRDLSFKAEDRAENIRRVGEVAKLFADAGVICIACLISPYERDREACRAMLPKGDFIEVFMDVPLEICEARDPKGLYKLARDGKIKGFTGIDDPYERPQDSEIVLTCKVGDCASPYEMAEKVIRYLEAKGYLEA